VYERIAALNTDHVRRAARIAGHLIESDPEIFVSDDRNASRCQDEPLVERHRRTGLGFIAGCCRQETAEDECCAHAQLPSRVHASEANHPDCLDLSH
jgi:hypothetical protein